MSQIQSPLLMLCFSLMSQIQSFLLMLCLSLMGQIQKSKISILGAQLRCRQASTWQVIFINLSQTQPSPLTLCFSLVSEIQSLGFALYALYCAVVSLYMKVNVRNYQISHQNGCNSRPLLLQNIQ